MTTMIQDAPTVKPTLLTIKGNVYSVSPLDPVEEGTAAYRLDKQRGEGVYDVVRNHDGLVVCDCPDYTCRHAGTVRMCKHGRSLVEAGMLAAPCPTPTKPAVAPISGKDRQRAATWGLKLPDVPVEVLTPAPVPVVVEAAPIAEANPRDSWPDWTDSDTWELGPDPVEIPVPTAPTRIERPRGEPRPTYSERFIPTLEQEAEHLGYELGAAGERVNAPAGWEFDRLVSFYRGWLDGKTDLEAESQESDAWLAQRERDVFGDPMDRLHPAELIEAGFGSGRPVFEA